MLSKAVPLWMCDDCGGPAVWTFMEGHVYYHCERQCDGFMQMELSFPGWGTRYVRGDDADDDDDENRLPF